ncbi:MAG TPA: hypothetical protein VIS94_07880 [Desulfomonilia bacterium]
MNSIHNIKNINKERLISIIQNFDRSKIQSIFIWTMQEYQQTVSLYSIQKDNHISEIDAFVPLWLASVIDYENWWQLNKCMDENTASDLYEYQLKKYIEDIDFVIQEPCFISQYSKGQIDEKSGYVKKFRPKFPFRSDDLDVASTLDNGIYLNYKFINEETFSFKEVKVVSGYQLRFDKSYAGYRDLFFESEKEYFYFTE